MKKMTLVRIVLSLSVLAFGVQTGAATYEMLVVTPLWAGDPPASVRDWNPVPEFAIQPARYWRPGSLALLACTLALLACSAVRTPARGWCLLAGLCGLAGFLATLFFFVPILQRTILDRGATLSDAQVVDQVQAWVSWNWMRYGVLVVGWLATIDGVARLGTNAPAASRGT